MSCNPDTSKAFEITGNIKFGPNLWNYWSSTAGLDQTTSLFPKAREISERNSTLIWKWGREAGCDLVSKTSSGILQRRNSLVGRPLKKSLDLDGGHVENFHQYFSFLICPRTFFLLRILPDTNRPAEKLKIHLLCLPLEAVGRSAGRLMTFELLLSSPGCSSVSGWSSHTKPYSSPWDASDMSLERVSAFPLAVVKSFNFRDEWDSSSGTVEFTRHQKNQNDAKKKLQSHTPQHAHHVPISAISVAKWHLFFLPENRRSRWSLPVIRANCQNQERFHRHHCVHYQRARFKSALLWQLSPLTDIWLSEFW